MKYLKIYLIFNLLSFLSCSTMTVYSNLDQTRYSSAYSNFNMIVKSGDKILNDYINNIAYFEFSKYVPINEQRNQTGILEVIYQSNDDKVKDISKTSYSDTGTYGEVNPNYRGGLDVNKQETTVKNEQTTVRVFNFQNSTMFVVMKDLQGNRIWAANYNYKGSTELTGVLVNTPQEAAKLCIEKISKNMGQKFTRTPPQSKK